MGNTLLPSSVDESKIFHIIQMKFRCQDEKNKSDKSKNVKYWKEEWNNIYKTDANSRLLADAFWFTVCLFFKREEEY